MDELKNSVFCLIFKCPKDKESKNCPLSEFRKLPTEEGLEKINELKHRDLIDIFEHHEDCTNSEN